jgi:hypothetical protein
MRFNQTTLLNIALIVIFGLALTQAEAYMGDYQIYILKLIFINAILALSLNLIYGFTGLFSLGHAGFMAIGAYVGALCTLLPEQKEIMWILDPIIWPFSVLHTPFWVAVIAGGLVAMIFAFIIAVPVLRLGDDYLGFAEIIRVVIVNATSITNGSLGIKGIPGEATLLTCYIWTVITLVVLSRLIFSNFGNVLRCIRDNEIAAGVMGINVPLQSALLLRGGLLRGRGRRAAGQPPVHHRPQDVQLPADLQRADVRGGRRPGLADRQPAGRHHRHHPVGMAARHRGAHGLRRVRDPGHPRHAYGGLLAHPAGHHPVPA